MIGNASEVLPHPMGPFDASRIDGELDSSERYDGTPLTIKPAGAIRFLPLKRQEDVVRSITIGREYHAESRYRHIPFSEEKFLRVYGAILAKPERTFAMVAERGGTIVGVMSGEVGEYFLGDGWRIATNHVLYVSETVRHTAVGGRIAIRLMRFFSEWAKEKGADEIQITAMSGIDPGRADLFLRRLNFRAFGGCYSIAL